MDFNLNKANHQEIVFALRKLSDLPELNPKYSKWSKIGDFFYCKKNIIYSYLGICYVLLVVFLFSLKPDLFLILFVILFLATCVIFMLFYFLYATFEREKKLRTKPIEILKKAAIYFQTANLDEAAQRNQTHQVKKKEFVAEILANEISEKTLTG